MDSTMDSIPETGPLPTPRRRLAPQRAHEPLQPPGGPGAALRLGRRPCEPHCARDQKRRSVSALSDTPAHGSHERTTERRTPAPSRPSELDRGDGHGRWLEPGDVWMTWK